jgi:sulfur carrier protein ThiS
MMKVTVKLFGTLSRGFPAYDPDKGLEVEVREGANVRDLVEELKISEVKGSVVTAGGKVLHLEDPLEDGVAVHLLQAAYGG